MFMSLRKLLLAFCVLCCCIHIEAQALDIDINSLWNQYDFWQTTNNRVKCEEYKEKILDLYSHTVDSIKTGNLHDEYSWNYVFTCWSCYIHFPQLGMNSEAIKALKLACNYIRSNISFFEQHSTVGVSAYNLLWTFEKTLSHKYLNMGLYKEGIELSSRIAREARLLKDSTLYDKLSDLGIAYSTSFKQDDMIKSIPYFEEALTLSKKTNDFPHQLSNIQSLLGNYVLTGQYTRAIETADSNRILIQKANTDNYRKVWIQIVNWICLANEHLDYSISGSFDKTLKLRKELLTYNKNIYGESSVQYLSSLRLYALMCTSKKDSSTINIYQKIYKIWSRIENKESYGEFYTFLNDYYCQVYNEGNKTKTTEIENYLDSLCKLSIVDALTKADYYLNRSINEFNNVNYQTAIVYAKLAEQVAMSNTDRVGFEEKTSEILSHEARINYCLGNIGKAKEKAYAAYEIINRLGIKNLNTASILAQIANILDDIGDYGIGFRIRTESFDIRLAAKTLPLADVLPMFKYCTPQEKIEMINNLLKYPFLKADAEYPELLLTLCEAYILTNDIERASSTLEIAKKFFYTRKTDSEILRRNIKADILFQEAGIAIGRKYYKEAIRLLCKHDSIVGYRDGTLTALFAATGDTINLCKDLSYRMSFIKGEISKRFIFMSNHERELYMKNRMATSLLEFCNYAAFYHNIDSCLVQAYNAVLLLKGLSVESSWKIKEALENSFGPDYYKKTERLSRLNKQLTVCTNKEDRDKIQLTINQEEQYLQHELGDSLSNEYIVTLNDVASHLQNGSIALEFITYDAKMGISSSPDSIRYAVLVLTAKGKAPLFIDLCSEQDLLKLVSKGAEIYDSASIYKLVWKPLEHLIKQNKTVFYSPIGLMHLLNLDVDAELYEPNVDFIRLSSTRELCMTSDANKISSAVLYGGLCYDCKYDNTDSLDGYGSENYLQSIKNISLTRGELGYLVGSLKEVEDIENMLCEKGVNSKIFEKNEGTESSFKNLNNLNVSILHIATHSFSFGSNVIPDYDEPMRKCGILLSGAKLAWEGKDSTKRNSYNDGILLGEDIASMHFKENELVVLSSCNSALGEITVDGVWGLQRAFKKAGAKTILSSLWKVDDTITNIFMDYFYKCFLSGEEKHKALKETRSYIRNYKNEEGKLVFSDPYYWAGFIMID